MPKPTIFAPTEPRKRDNIPEDDETSEFIMEMRAGGASIAAIQRELQARGIGTSHANLTKRIKAEEMKRLSETAEQLDEEKTISELREKGATVRPASPRTEELRRLAIATGNTRAIEPQAPMRGREVRGDEEVTERYGIGPDGLDLSDVDMGGEVAD